MITPKLLLMIADDDEDDRFFIRKAIQAVIPDVAVVEAQDGQELMTLLRHSDHQSAERPVRVILLDMNMPRLNGLETLQAIRADSLLSSVPAVMISTSAHPEMVAEAYRKGINSYIKKPSSYADFNRIAEAIKICFLEVIN